MATFEGRFEDVNGNVYYSECTASDVQMSNGSSAQDAIDSINTKYTTLQSQINDLSTYFATMIDEEEE